MDFEHIIMPAEKSRDVDDALKAVFGIDRRSCILSRTCTCCGGDVTEFRDALSRKEFSISGACQKCQDLVFQIED